MSKFKGARNGRAQALGIIDRICSESDTQELIEAAVRKYLAENTLGFYREFVIALAPKEIVSPEESVWAELSPDEAVKLMDKRTMGRKKKRLAKKRIRKITSR